MQPLSPRQQSIFNRIVDSHIETAQPVGSRFITEIYRDLYRQSYSPATVRHEMGQLEQKGYLTHPHTSAGRVPTDLGYRYYVDHSLRPEPVPAGLVQDFEAPQRGEIDSFAEDMLSKLSDLLDEASLLIVSDEEKGRHRFFVHGSSRLLDKPEFQNLKAVGVVLRALEDRRHVAQWFAASSVSDGVTVRIGGENEPEALRQCSVVSFHYGTEGRVCGTIAVMGPRRMRYAKAVSLVAYMGSVLNRASGEQE